MQNALSTMVVVAALLASLVTGVEPAAAAEKQGQGATVVAEGAGLSAEEALKSAFQNAVRQVVGAYLDAETLIENDRIVSQRILTYSNGFISDYQLLEETSEGAIYRARIAAVVERRPLLQRLSDHNLVTQDVDGRALVAETLTRREAERAAADLLASTFEGFPANVLRAEVLGRPTVVDRDERTVQLRYRVRLAVDPQLYNVFETRLITVLDQVATHQGSISARCVNVPTKYRDYGNDFFCREFLAGSRSSRVQATDADFGPFRSMVKTTPTGALPGEAEPPSDHAPLLFVVQTGSGSSGFQTDWRWFQARVPFQVAQPTLQVSVDHVDGGGTEIGRDSFHVGPRTPALSVDSRLSRDGSPVKVVISPYVLFHSGSGYRAEVVTFARDMTLERHVNLSLSELADVERVQCRITVANR